MAASARKLRPEVAQAADEVGDVVEDLFYVANLLDGAGRSKLSSEAAELAEKASAFFAKLKGELK